MGDGVPARVDVFPTLRYRDPQAAMAWLSETLGFRRGLEVPEPDGAIAHAELHIGSGVVMIGTVRDRPDPTRPWEASVPGIYIAVDDIDAHYAHAKAAGAEIFIELHDTDYGSRDYGVRDPEGNTWFFGTYRPDPR